MTVASLEGVDAGYRADIPVLRGIDLFLDVGTTLVVGPNGSGKSTLTEVLGGSLRPQRGTARIGGHEAHTAPARALRSVCRSTPTLYPTLTLREHVDLVDLGRPGVRKRLDERIDGYGLAPWVDYATSELSTGNLRKAWIVLCTAAEGRLVVLDEPFNGLDDLGAKALIDEITRWCDDGHAVVVVAHQPPPSLIADRTVRFSAGSVAGTTPLKELR